MVHGHSVLLLRVPIAHSLLAPSDSLLRLCLLYAGLLLWLLLLCCCCFLCCCSSCC